MPDAGEPSRLSVVLKRGSFGQLVLGYVLGTYAVLEIVVTFAELAGWSLSVKRWLVVVLALGLILVVAAAAMLRGARALRASSPEKVTHRREALLISAAIAALLPMLFVARGDTLFGVTIRWIMWRDSPVWAVASVAVAIVLGLLWVLSKPTPTDDEGSRQR